MPQCECASTALEGTDAHTKCGCPLVVVCGCGAECGKCNCKHEGVTKCPPREG
uniref:C-terminal domain of cystein rich protein HE716995 n=1 Tax=uncultured eukaryote TaxID=100272 RepID=A0A1M4NDK7_9EUKA|nr:C-terminal domain of cystein rich protein HE716995 [uncultured eukaryote]